MELREDNPEDVFEMLEKLGEGAYGIVCKCQDKKTGKLYAVKVIEMDAGDEATIKREVEILQQCQSESVVQYGGCWKHGGTLLIAMEFCDGGSVQDVIRVAKRQFTEEEIGAICAEVVQGLVYLHSHHIMHRDIKSGNILLTQSGRAKLADFGVSASLVSTMQKKHSVIGSPYWMAPEIIANNTDGYDSRADIWSLGITAIEMAEKEPPRYDIHFARVIFLIARQPPPTFKNPSAWSDDFNDFVNKCLGKNPADRPTAKQLLSHPFIRRGIGKNKLIEKVVTESLPAIEEHRRDASDRASQTGTGTGTFEDDSDSDTYVRQPITMRRSDSEGASDTFCEAQSLEEPDSIQGLDYGNIKTYV